jgi:hypothetical protein
MLGNIAKKQMAPQKSVVTTRLADCLIEGLGKSDREAVPPHSGMWFRSSGIPYLCPRLYALALRDEFLVNEPPDADLMWTFGVGTAFHTQFQEDYLQRLGDVFQGWWRDRDKGTVHKGTTIHDHDETLSHLWIPKPTEEWQGTNHEYVELEFRNEEYRITGHCDGVLVWPDSDPEILEIKTINTRGFDFVDPIMGGKPKVEHVAQAQAYMWLSGLTKARILYIKKDLSVGPRKVMCEHLIERDESIIDGIKSMLKECASVVDNGVDDLPARLPECRTKTSGKARWCAGKGPCFR